MRKILLVLFYFICSTGNAQTDEEMAFDIRAITQVSPPSIKLVWEITDNNKQVYVSRKLKSDATFGAPVKLAANATEYTDNAVVAGTVYEYHVAGTTANEYLSVGINVPLVDYRGKLILIVEQSLATPLTTEIDRLMMDIRGDGWQVKRIDVNKSDKPSDVRALIKTEYLKDTVNTKTVFILGQVPQPLSGCIMPDGHGEHYGAWATEMYYADMDGTWTDATANCAGTFNANIPGDGKFDQSYAPTKLEFQIGRVDLSNLPVFTESYTELQRRYLEKDHNFKMTKILPPRKAFVTDGFKMGFAWSGFYYFNALLGKSNVTFPSGSSVQQPYDNYLWFYASSAGESNGFVATSWHSDQFAKNTYNQVFSMIFGSFFGDYQMSNNFMKAALASKGWILTCSWSGRPWWYYHHMANGENIGYSSLINMNNAGTYSGGYSRQIHVAQLGDPTLRQEMVRPPANVKSTLVSGHVKITWSAPDNESVDGYHIYRANGLDSVFVRITSSLLTDTSWTDPDVAAATYYYQVRSIRLEKGRCGSYYNNSRGMFVSNDPALTDYPLVLNKPRLVHPLPDQTGLVRKAFNLLIPANTFADDDAEQLAYSVYEADSTGLPYGWNFSTMTRTIGTLPAPNKPAKIKMVVKATDMSGSFATDTFEINITWGAGLQNTPVCDNKVTIYSNPASEFITLEFNSDEPGNTLLTVLNTEGVQMDAATINAVKGLNSVSYSVTSLTAGIYFVTVQTDRKTLRGRIVVSR